MRRIITYSAVFLVVGGVALADPFPNMVPTHDVSGTYLMTDQRGPHTLSVEYSAALHTARFTPEAGQGYVIYDFAAHDAKMVMPQMQRYMDQPELAAQADMYRGDKADAVITAEGSKTVAGYACTVTKVTDSRTGDWSELCVTPDGVILEIDGSKGQHVVAQSISYATVPEADVQVPAGYSEFQMPAMGMAPPPPGQ